MPKGILCLKYAGWKTDLLIFICPGCNKEHSIDVTTEASFEKIPLGSTETIHVWHYSINKQVNEIATLDITPSFDASKYCGYHGPFNWSIEAMIIPPNRYRNETSELWLNS